MKFFSGFISLILSSVLFLSCGTQPSNQSQTNSQPMPVNKIAPLFLVMGGQSFFGACDIEESSKEKYELGFSMAFYPRVIDMLNATKTDIVKTDLLFSCFNDRTIYWMNAKYKENRYRTKNVETYLAEVKKLIKLVPNRPVFIIGHSYGGWLAMQLANRIPDVKITGIYTVDPISNVNCRFVKPFGCTEAPMDLTGDHRKKVNDVSRTWFNFYQKETIYLHSDSMVEADFNSQYKIGHIEIINSKNIWSVITSNIKTHLSNISQGKYSL